MTGSFFARDEYTATSSQTDFTISFPYLSATHVEVYVDGVEQTEGADDDYTIVGSSTVRFNSGLTGGETVVLLRNSSRSTRLVDYASGADLTEEDLDTDSLQAFYLVQEAIDAADNALGVGTTGLWDAGGVRITELDEPVDGPDAATKAYVDEVLATTGNLPASAETEDGDILSVTVEGTVAWAELSEATIPDGLIDAGMIATGAVGNAELGDGAVDEEHFAEEAVGSADIQAGVVDEVHFAEEAVATADIEDAAVTLAKFDPTAGTEGQFLTNEEATSVVWSAAPESGVPAKLTSPTTVGVTTFVSIEPAGVTGRTAWRILLNGVSSDNAGASIQLQVNDDSSAVAGNYETARNGADTTVTGAWDLTPNSAGIFDGWIDIWVDASGFYLLNSHLLIRGITPVDQLSFGKWAGTFGTGFTGFTLSVDAGNFDGGTYQVFALPEKEYSFA